jgi:hypothetical protein
MHVDGVGLKVIGEGTKEQLRDNTTLFYVEVVLDLIIAPVG